MSVSQPNSLVKAGPLGIMELVSVAVRDGNAASGPMPEVLAKMAGIEVGEETAAAEESSV